MIDNPTVTTDKEFTSEELELIIEALKLYEVSGRRMALRVMTRDGDEVRIAQISEMEDGSELIDGLESGEFEIIPTASGPMFTDEEEALVSGLASIFIGGLRVAEKKLEKLIKDTAEESLPGIISGLTEMLKKQGK